MNRLLDRIFYIVESAFIRSTVFQLLAVALLILLISLAGGTAVWLSDSSQFQTYGSAIWWAFLRLTDPGYLGDDKETFARIVSTILTVLGYVVFLGALVAIMTTWLNRAMFYLKSGRSQIFESDHILIIGWNPRMHAIIEEIVRSKDRVVKRLGRIRLPAVVILTGQYDSSLLTDIRQRLKEDVRDEVRLLIRSGNPLEAESLDRVDFASASSIILMSNYESPVERHLADITLIKTLMSMRARARELELEDVPNVVINIRNPANKLLAENVGFYNRTEAIATDEFLSRLICQSIRNPGVSSISQHLLTDSWGESVYLTPVEELEIAGLTLAEISLNFQTSIPIGFIRDAGKGVHGHKLYLLGFNEKLRKGDEIVSIAPDLYEVAEGYDETRTERVYRRINRDNLIGTMPPVPQDNLRKLLIVGSSHLIPGILNELGQYQNETYDVTIVSELPVKMMRSRIDDTVNVFDNITICYHQAEMHRPEEVVRIKPETFDNIAFLAPEVTTTAQGTDLSLIADSETILAHLLVERRLKRLGMLDDVAITVELHEEDNRELFDASHEIDVVMTTEITAHLFAQVAVRRALAWIYEELFTKGGPDVHFRSFDRYYDLKKEESLTFEACQIACLEAGAVAIGMKLVHAHGRLAPGMYLNPLRGHVFKPSPEDRLIVIEPQAYDVQNPMGD